LENIKGVDIKKLNFIFINCMILTSNIKGSIMKLVIKMIDIYDLNEKVLKNLNIRSGIDE
jgi:hypothetical protein